MSRPLTGLVAVACLTVLSAAPAAAHVTVSSPDASPGGFGKLVVRVPTESDTASTTKVVVTLPADTPFAFVSTRPHAGWEVATTERTLDEPVTVEGFTLSKAVATVTWTATDDAAGIAPGQFDEFELSLGPFPTGTDALSFPAEQTYSDGTVVGWDEPVVEGGDEPEHPAPVLVLADADSTGADDTAADDGAPTDASDEAGSDGTARGLAAAALVVAVVGLALAGLSAAGVVGRRRPTT